MLRQLFNFDRNQKFILACSGGVDSMAIADFYKRGNKSFEIAYFNHATPMANTYQSFVKDWCEANEVVFNTAILSCNKIKGQSAEEFWRIERYNFLNSFNLPIVTCHHLNDVLETWIWSSAHGNPKIVLPKHGNVFRPFLLNKKEDMLNWCIKHGVKWIEDPSNTDENYTRNFIRHNLISQFEKINPGIWKTLRKKVIDTM